MLRGRLRGALTTQKRAFSSKDGNSAKDAPSAPFSSIIEKVKDFFLFNKDATPFVNYTNEAKSGEGYRYPSPESRGPANVPRFENEDDAYNTQLYTRDTMKNPASILVVSSEGKKFLVGNQVHEKASLGRKNPDVFRYDSSGTRSAMTTTQAAMMAEVDKHRPNHLPVPFWTVDGSESLEEEAKRKNLPPLLGRQATWSTGAALYEEVPVQK